MNRSMFLGAVALLALAGCGDKGGEGPKGQVVATVEGEDVTIHELNAELQSMALPPNTARKDAERAALQNIVTRRLLMQAARERKLDQNPQYLMQQRRTNEQLLVAALGRDITQRLEPVTREEAQAFQRRYPNLFQERKFFILDQIQFLRPPNIDRLPLGGAKTMEDVERLLINNNIEYRRQPASLDALSANPDFVNEVVGLYGRNPNEVFMFANQPQGAPAPVILINKITEMRTIPFTGERALGFAQNFLQSAKVQNALTTEVNRLREAGKQKVSYQAGYAPPAPPKAGPETKGGQPDRPPTPAEVAAEAEAAGDDKLAVPTEKASQNIVPK